MLSLLVALALLVIPAALNSGAGQAGIQLLALSLSAR